MADARRKDSAKPRSGERRGSDRRVAQLAIDTPDRRVAPRRSGKDRREAE